MPRKARQVSCSNIYHAIQRGINRQNIFEDDGDRHYFMNVLATYRELSGFRLHAFCLMSNHVHLLIEPANEPLDLIFKRIGAKYVGWYNRKYQRAGHLFQDRFRSEIVETDQYYMTVLRYILQNPMKAGIEPSPGSYRWSSYLAYEKGAGAVTDTEHAVRLFGGREALIDYVRQSNEDTVMDESSFDWRVRDDQAKIIMHRISGCDTVSDFQKLDNPFRKIYMQAMYRERLSMGQIARLTGMSKTTVFRAVQHCDRSIPEANTVVLRESSASPFEIIW